MQFYPPGARIAGRYEVAGRPMIGGMGIVYVCLDLEEERPVALKTFRPEYLPDRAARDRFLREGTHWVDLGAHPHIVRCYNVLYSDPEVYLVLELVAKEQGRDDASLRAWLTPGVPLPVEQALLFALQIARGMQHAVDTIPGFVHRDLKPENVLVGADRVPNTDMNRLRVTDFGLAAALELAGSRRPAAAREGWVKEGEGSGAAGSLGRTQLTRGVVGTPLYMAPEQWRRERVTVATDVYALGCILAEMLAGQRIVEGNSLAALERAHCTGQVRPLPAGVPAAAREVAARCLARQPAARYGSWAEVEAVLAAAYGAVTGGPAPTPEPTAALGRAERVAAGWSYSDMGASYLDLGKAEVALAYFERALAAGRAEGERLLQAAGLNYLALACARLGDARRAVGYHEQALAIDREIGNRKAEGVVLGNLGSAYLQLGDARRAIGYFEQALPIAREVGDRSGEGNALNNLGCAYLQLGEIRRAIDYLEQALPIDREIGNRRREGNALGNLGEAYRLLGDARRAIGYFEQTLAIDREIGNRRGEGNALGNLGSAYLQLGETRRAIDYYERRLAIAREIGDRRGEGSALSNLGNAYVQLGDARRAVEYWQRAAAIFEEIGDVMGAAMVGSNLAVLLVEQGRHADALPHAQRAAQVFAQIGHAQYAQRAQDLLAEIRAAQP
jgi:tetratricopeptide (TPR) repeat protein